MAGDVLIFAEHLEGRIAPSTLEAIAIGRELASRSGGHVRVALFGEKVRSLADALAGHGVEVLLAEEPALAEYTPDAYGQAAQSIVESTRPRLILVAHTSQGYDLAPALAGTMDLPLVTNCLALRFDGEPIVATVRPGAAKAAGPAPGGIVTSTTVRIDGSKVRTRFLSIERPQVQDIDIAGADIIVSAGRGIQKKENLPLIEEFAKALGGVVGASRPLTDMDWLPKTRQVGQSGKTVRPKLYVACGISGAMQHVAGMKDASLIIAINTDPSAPIFEVAHVGIVADVLKLLPATLKELKS